MISLVMYILINITKAMRVLYCFIFMVRVEISPL